MLRSRLLEESIAVTAAANDSLSYSSRRFRQLLAVVLSMALGIRLFVLFTIPNEQVSDYPWYEQTARHFAVTGEFGPGRPSVWFSPGYALFLSGWYRLLGPSEELAKVVNI